VPGSAGTVHAVLPGDVDDEAVPSGGNTYDRRVLVGLVADGWTVHEIVAAGSWPRPSPADADALGARLAEVPDDAVVLLDGLVACGVPAVLAPHAPRLRLVVLVHLPLGDEVGLPRADATDLAARERAVLHLATAVVTTSAWTERRLVAVHAVDPARVHVAPPGVDPAPVAGGTAITGGPPRLLCVGALTPTKGQDLLVDALARVAHRPWTCRLVGPVARDPAFARAVRAAIVRHGLADRVLVTGPLRGPALDAAYAAADLLVLPSRTESYGMVVSEALARGIPVVAAAVGGVPEALDGPAGATGPRPGTLVPAEDVGALARALLGWSEQAPLRSGWRLSASGRRGTLQAWDTTSRHLARVLADPRSPAPRWRG